MNTFFGSCSLFFGTFALLRMRASRKTAKISISKQLPRFWFANSDFIFRQDIIHKRLHSHHISKGQKSKARSQIPKQSHDVRAFVARCRLSSTNVLLMHQETSDSKICLCKKASEFGKRRERLRVRQEGPSTPELPRDKRCATLRHSSKRSDGIQEGR